MKRLLVSLALCSLVGCTNNGRDDKSSARSNSAPTTQPIMADAKPINKYCPINKEDEVDPKVTTVYKGKVIGFCCPDCIDEFKKDPEKYMKTMK